MPKIIDDNQVFRATIEVLVRHGYENATTKAIAAAADMHEATLFRRYGSKFDLIDQAIQHQLADTPLNRLGYTGALRTDLLSILQAYVEVSKLRGDIILLLFFEVGRDPSLQQFMETPMKNIQVVLDIIEKYQAQGLLKAETPYTTLYALLGPVMMRNMAQKTNANAPLPDIDLEQFVDYFLNGRGR